MLLSPPIVPAQLPGGPEILVALLVLLVPFALATVVVAGLVYLVRRRTARVDALEARIVELEARVDDDEGEDEESQR